MVSKIAIVEKLGERAVLLPALIEAALAANDRLKISLTMLQEASAHAAQPGRASLSLEQERRAAGLADPAFDVMISGARDIDAAEFIAPGAERLAKGIVEDLAAMLAPVEVAAPEDAAPLKARLDAVLQTLPNFNGDRVGHAQIAGMAAARRGGADSLHLLVMDLHRAINRIAAATAVDLVDGAHVAGLDDGGRKRVKAFMSGLNRTARLAFGHPGLATTAGRIGARLTIQNDIGTTDAHVLVIHVEGLTATVDLYRRPSRPRQILHLSVRRRDDRVEFARGGA